MNGLARILLRIGLMAGLVGGGTGALAEPVAELPEGSPEVLYLVPWKDPEAASPLPPPAPNLGEAEIRPLDPERFRAHLGRRGWARGEEQRPPTAGPGGNENPLGAQP